MSSVLIKAGSLKAGNGVTVTIGASGDVTVAAKVQAVMEHVFSKVEAGVETFTFAPATLGVDAIGNPSVWMMNAAGTSMTFVQPDFDVANNGVLTVNLTGFPAGSYVLRFTDGAVQVAE